MHLVDTLSNAQQNASKIGVLYVPPTLPFTHPYITPENSRCTPFLTPENLAVMSLFLDSTSPLETLAMSLFPQRLLHPPPRLPLLSPPFLHP